MDFNPKNYFLERQGGGILSKIIQLNKTITSIGRAETNDQVLFSTYISRYHAEIRIKGNRLFLKDLGSSNGTYLNDFKLSNVEQEAKTGDMIGWGCSKSAFGMDPDLIFFHKVRVPEFISLDSDSDATDINELCDDLANNPGVDSFFNSATRSSANDEIICLSSDDEVEVDQDWVNRVVRRSSSPVPVSISGQAVSSSSNQTPKEQLPMVILPGSARVFKQSNAGESAQNEKSHSRSVPDSEPTEPVSQNKEDFDNIVECSVVIKRLSQEEIASFLNVKDDVVYKIPKKMRKHPIVNFQSVIKKLCDTDNSDSSDNIKHTRERSKKKKTLLECDMKSPMKMTIRKKSVDHRAKSTDSDSNCDHVDNSLGSPTQKKRKIMTRRHSVHEAKSDSAKTNLTTSVKDKTPTRIVPKRRASMMNDLIHPAPDKKLKQGIPERAIEIDPLPNKSMRQRSKYNEVHIKQTTKNATITSNSAIASNANWKKDRNEKIRKIAENQCSRISEDESTTVHRVKTIAKPVAKMTLHNRGTFLTENINETVRKYVPEKSKPISKTTIVTNAPQNSASNIKITIEQFRNSHLNAETSSVDNESQGVCNNVQFYQNIIPNISNNINNSNINNIHQRKLTITLDDEELERQKNSQKYAPAGFYNEIPLEPPTYSPTVAENTFMSSSIPGTSSKIARQEYKTPVKEKMQLLKSILTPAHAKKKNEERRVSFNQNLVQIREIPMIDKPTIDNDDNGDEDDDDDNNNNVDDDGEKESYKKFLDVAIEDIDPTDKILTEILSWCPSWLENVKGAINHPKKWQFLPMLQTYDNLDQYKKIIGPIINMELLANIKSKYENLTKGKNHKWSSLSPSGFSKISRSLFSFYVTGDVKDNRKSFSAGSLIIVKLLIKNKESKVFGYISESIDRNNCFKIQCCSDDLNYCSITTVNTVNILSVMYVRSELKSLLSLNQLTETEIMMKILKPETNKPAVTVTPNRNGIINLNESQSEISCRIVEDLIYNKDAKVIALQGGPGTGKTKVIVACVMKIITKSKNNCRILICSKSNTCIDEITHHLNSLSIENSFRLVRFGNNERISKSVVQVSLRHLSNQYLNSTNENINFQNAKSAVIQMADVVCSTMNSSYDLITEYKKHFDVCFIDEASQFTDADLIIPVQSGFRKLVLVGDSKQLQPNVNAAELKNLNFEVSLLERMNRTCETNSTKNPVLTLTIQHRMHQDIFKFPNHYFYKNKISTSLPSCSNIALKPYMVFGLKCNQNLTQDTSSYNTGEIKFCYHLCESLLTILPPNLTISIITPYLRQREEVLKFFKDGERTNEQKSRVEVHTIDSAQGLEKDIVIMSVVKTHGVGFLANPQRLNVALTRAKKALYICGNFSSLRNNSMWKALLDDSKHRKCYRDIEPNAPNCQIISSIKRDIQK